jgi:hypothetical protein
LRNFGEDAKNAALKHMKNIAASEITTKISKWLTESPEMASKRWAFELIQNALDAGLKISNNEVKIKVETILEDGNKYLVFKHNGGPFSDEEVCGIIYGGTTKREAFSLETEYIGRFGRGFLISHVLNRRVSIKGIGEDEDKVKHRFQFILDRTSDNENDIITDIDQCFVQLSTNSPVVEANDSDWFAAYKYMLDKPDAISAADNGILTLEKYLPFILAFNNNLVEVAINDKIFTKKVDDTSQSMSIITTLLNGQPYGNKILSKTNEDSNITAGIICGDNLILPVSDEIPRLFISMPLISSEKIPLPFVISSLSLYPTEERDMVYLAGSEEKPKHNREVFQTAIELYHEIIDFCISKDYGQLYHLCDYSPVSLDFINGTHKEYWSFWQDKIKSDICALQTKNIVKTDTGLSIPEDVIFPIPQIDISQKTEELAPEVFSAFYKLVKGFGKSIPEEASIYQWQKIAMKWKMIDESLSLNFYTIKILTDEIAKASLKGNYFQTIDSVSGEFGITSENFKKLLVELFKIVDDLYSNQKLNNDFIDRLLLNQNGSLVKKSLSVRDINKNLVQMTLGIEAGLKGIPPELGNLTSDIGFDIWSVLVDPEFSAFKIVKDFLANEYTVDKVINEMIKYKLASKAKIDLNNQRDIGWAKFFVWCVSNLLVHEELPVFTKDNTVIYASSKDYWPILLLPFNESNLDQTYEHLIPDSKILNSKYFEILPNDDNGTFKQYLSQLGICSNKILQPVQSLKIKRDKLKQILVDSSISIKSGEHTLHAEHGNINTLIFSDSIYGKISQLPETAKEFLEFVIKVISEQDNGWLSPLSVTCSCGSTHNIYPSEWLADIKVNEWVAYPKDDEGTVGHREANRETLDKLLLPVGINKIIQYKNGIALLSHFGYDELDLKLRQRTHGIVEEEKELRRQLSQVVEMGADVGDIIQYLKDSDKKRKQALDNHTVGKSIEEIIQEILRDEGVTKFKISGIGSDLEIWPEEDGVDCGRFEATSSSKPESYLVEIKFTTGKRARLSKKQAETAIENDNKFFILVIEGSSELKDQLLNGYSTLVKDQINAIKKEVLNNCNISGGLSRKLLSAPNPDEIEPDLNGYWVKDALWIRGLNMNNWVSKYIF